MNFPHSPIIDRRHGLDRRHDCTGCPVNGEHCGTRARMLPAVITLLSISAVFSAGWVAGQARISERRTVPVMDTIMVPAHHGPPAPVPHEVVR